MSWTMKSYIKYEQLIFMRIQNIELQARNFKPHKDQLQLLKNKII